MHGRGSLDWDRNSALQNKSILSHLSRKSAPPIVVIEPETRSVQMYSAGGWSKVKLPQEQAQSFLDDLMTPNSKPAASKY